MKSLIDTIFGPVLGWLVQARGWLSQASVPVSRGLHLENFLGPLKLLGPVWSAFIGTVVVLAVTYTILFLVLANRGMVVKFKDTVKWW